jgi:hypothetical protein
MRNDFFSDLNFKGFSSALSVVFMISITTGFYSCGTKDDTKSPPSGQVVQDTVSAKPEQVQQASAPVTDKKLLEGSWVRSDAEYVISIENMADDGSVRAQYFNPKPIHVGKAGWRNDGGFIVVYVELQDVNYPGSNYTLVYLPDKEMLAGQYYQAVDKETFDVSFNRINK